MKYFTKEFYTLQRLAFANNYLKTSKKAEKKNDKFYQRIYDKRCDFYVSNERRCEPYIDPKEELRKIDELCNAPDISDEERNAFFADVTRAAKAIHKVFKPDKLNYGAYGDTGCHLHIHLCPKYKGGDEWGGTFTMNPQKVYLSDEEYAKMIDEIKNNL